MQGVKSHRKVPVEGFRELLAHMVRDELLTDREIGARLGVANSTVSHWRVAFGIGSVDKFSKKFEQTYGLGALDIFRYMVAQGSTLAEIAEAFHFSREYARQVFKKIYGMGWLEAQERGHA